MINDINFLTNASLYLNNSNKNKKKIFLRNILTIHITCWGRFLTLLSSLLLPSLFQKNNIPKIIETEFEIHILIHCLKSEIDTIFFMFKKYNHENHINIELIPHPDPGSITKNSLGISLQIAKDDSSYILLAPPDTFYSDGAIFNSLEISKAFQAAVAIPHLRASKNFVQEIQSNLPSIPPKKLVKIVFCNPHQNTETAFTKLRNSSSFISGICIFNISPKTYLLVHRLPTIGTFPVTQSDIDYFEKKSLTQYDHEWPSFLLVEGRYKCITSSNIAFAAEYTEDQSHICQTQANDGLDNYAPNRSLGIYFHKEINRFPLITLESE